MCADIIKVLFVLVIVVLMGSCIPLGDNAGVGGCGSLGSLVSSFSADCDVGNVDIGHVLLFSHRRETSPLVLRTKQRP